MISRITILGTLLLLAIAVMSGSVSNRNRALAAEYNCKNSQCPNTAKCEGNYWTKTGECTISCYRETGTPGEIVFSGSANCGTGSGGGGGGPTGFYYPDGGYCYNNWWWDPECSGPDDPYTPPKVN